MLTNIELQQLRCVTQKDGGAGANPYLWALLLQIDDDTIATGAPVFVADRTPYPGGTSVVIRAGMKDGESAPIPDLVSHLSARFHSEPPLSRRDLILVALLIDQHDLPGAAVAQGYLMFLEELPAQVTQHLLQLASPDATVRADAVDAIKHDLTTKISSAMLDALSESDQIAYTLGLKTVDRELGSDFALFAQVDVRASKSFTLEFHSDTGDDFALDAQLLVTDDPCEDALLLVESLQTAIANAEGAAKQLANAHGGEPTPRQQQEMEQLAKEIRADQAKLKAAEEVLRRCRAGLGPGPGNPTARANRAGVA